MRLVMVMVLLCCALLRVPLGTTLPLPTPPTHANEQVRGALEDIEANGAGAAAPSGAARGGKRQAERSAQQERGKGALFAAIGARAQERAARGGAGIAADAVDPACSPLQSLLSVGSAGEGNAGTGSSAERGTRASV